MTATRQLRFRYGVTTVSAAGAQTSATLVEVHRIRRSSTDFEVSFSFLLNSVDGVAANFGSAVEAYEAAFSQRGQRLIVTTGPSFATTLLDIDEQGTTTAASDVVAEISKPGGDYDTALSRLYEVTIRGNQTLTGLATGDGLSDLTHDLTRDGSCRQTLTVTATAQAISGATATVNATSKAGIRAAALISALGGQWKLVRQDVTDVNMLQSVATVEQEWVESIFDDTATSVNDARLKNVSLKIQRSREGAMGSRDERRLATMTATYSADVCHTETTALDALYTGELSPWIIANMRLSAPGSFFALISDSPEFDLTANKITATLVALTSSGGNLLELDRTETLRIDHGAIYADVWPESPDAIESEAPTPAYVWPGPKTVEFTESVKRVEIGGAQSVRPFAAGGHGGQPVGALPGAGGRGLFDLSGPFGSAFGIGVISAPGESFLQFLGPDEGGGGGAAGGGAAQAAGTPGQVRGIPSTTERTVRAGVRGISPDQFDVTETTVTRTTRYVAGVSGAGGAGGQPADNRTRTR